MTPPKGMDRLLGLQELDLSIDRLRHRREELEAEDDLREARRMHQQAEDRLGELRLALDSVNREASRLEGDVDGFGRKIADEERRLYDGSVAHPRELESIRAEIEGLRARRSRVEDELLEQMERREELEGRIATAEAELGEARHRIAEITGRTGIELQQIEASLSDRQAEREALLPEFDGELLELYEDLRRQKKGVGVAALVDGVCQGCHQSLSSAEMARLKRDQGIRRCEYCARILVFA